MQLALFLKWEQKFICLKKIIQISIPLFPELHWKSLITINHLSTNGMHFQTRDISLSRFTFVSYFSNPSTFINILWCIKNLINSWQNLINCLSGWRTLRLRDCRILEIHFVARLWNKKRNKMRDFIWKVFHKGS